MSEIKLIASQGRIYLLANVINRSAGLLLIPLYTHVLGAEDFGVYAIVIAVSELFTIVFGMGFAGAMNRFYFDYQDNPAEQNRVVSTTLIGFFLVSIAILLLCYPLAGLVVQIMFESQEHHQLFVLVIAGLIFTILYEIELSYAVIRKRAWTYMRMAMAKATLFICLNLLLLLHFDKGVAGIVYATVIALGSLSVIVAALLLSHLGLAFSPRLFGSMLKFGLPLIPSAFANAALPLVERYFLNSMVGPAAVGIYALGHRLASMLQMFIAAPFSQIFFVRRFETLAKGENQDAFNRLLLLFVIVMTTAALGLSLFGREIVWLIAPSEYSEAIMLLPILGLCFVLSSLNLNIEIGIFYEKKTWAIALIGLVVLIVSIPTNYVFISSFGLIGAALSLLAINILRIVITIFVNASIGSSHIKLDWTRAVFVLVIGLVLGVAVQSLEPAEIEFQWVALKVLVCIAFLALILTTPLLDKESKKELGLTRT